ncbi:MAG: hypothetical protein V2B15_10480 [Bacteroidota bacterium]
MPGKTHISILLLVSFSFLIAHNLVPHQHHLETSFFPVSHSSPASQHDHHDGNTGTRHCHAFNNIDLVKYNPSGMPDPVSLNTHLITPGLPGVPGPLEAAEISRLFRGKPPIHSALGSRPPSLRAPPSIG